MKKRIKRSILIYELGYIIRSEWKDGSGKKRKRDEIIIFGSPKPVIKGRSAPPSILREGASESQCRQFHRYTRGSELRRPLKGCPASLPGSPLHQRQAG